MISRRDFLQVSMATAALYGASGFGNWARLAAQQALTQDELLKFDTFGNLSLIHVTDIHGQLKPLYFREPSINIGVGDNRGAVPHITGADFRRAYGIADGSAAHYALSSGDFDALSRTYGKIGGLDRMATVINAISSAPRRRRSKTNAPSASASQPTLPPPLFGAVTQRQPSSSGGSGGTITGSSITMP